MTGNMGVKFTLTCPLLALCSSKKEKFNEKKKLQPEKRRSRAHAVKNDRLRFFHGGFTQVGRTTEQSSRVDLVLFVIDVVVPLLMLTLYIVLVFNPVTSIKPSLPAQMVGLEG